MNLRSPRFLLLLLFSVARVRAQDVETQYLKLQETYTQRVEAIRQQFGRNQRELLNKFILALVRVEQGYRDDGELDGVIYCRELRENLLLNPKTPAQDPNAPPVVADMLKTFEEKRQEALTQFQNELDKINLTLFSALGPYQREYTRQGLTDKAIEIQKLREVLQQSAERTRADNRATASLNTDLSADPNQYPFALEGPGYKHIRGVIPRTCLISLTPTITDSVKETPLGYAFVNGRLTFPANESGPLLQDIARNNMFSAEVAFKPAFDRQGHMGNPAVVFQIGESVNTALFAITIEGTMVHLRFKTDTPPPDRENHRYQIGRLTNSSPAHIIVTYRSGDLTVYFNGEVSLQLRNEVTGTLKNWTESPISAGRAGSHPRDHFILPFRGVLNHVYLKAGDISSRQAVANYNRYLLLFED